MDTDIKPNIKSSPNILANCDAVNSDSSPFVRHDLNDMGHIEGSSSNMCQDTSKQEFQTESTFGDNCQVKEEIMYCQSCSYCDADSGRLKFHLLREHPTGIAVVANRFDEAICHLHDITLFCVKETCSFSTDLCNDYEVHIMSCCMLHDTLSEDERERLKSTVKFVLDFHSKHDLKAVPGFLDYVSTFSAKFMCQDDNVQINEDLEYSNSSSMLSDSVDLDLSVNCGNTGIKYDISSFPTPVLLFKTQNTDFNDKSVAKKGIFGDTSLSIGEQEIKHESYPYNVTFASTSEGESVLVQSGEDHDVSENVALETDVAGSPTDNNLPNVTKGDNVKDIKMYYGECYTKNPHVSSQQSGNITSVTTETGHVGHSSDFYNDVIRMDGSHFYSDVTPDMNNHHCDMKLDSGKQSFKNNMNIEKSVLKMDFIQHKKNQTKVKSFRCDECGKTFSRCSNLTVHMRTHTGEKPYKCNECGKTFSHSSRLNVHSRMHTGEKPFKCNECGKTFSYKSSFNRHGITHKVEKSFKCFECCKTFRRYSHLTQHRVTHSVEKPFKCNECEKTFGRRDSLVLHKRIHTGEKPFKCNDCGKAYGSNRSLIFHRKVHTREKPFKCDECGKTFGHSSSLVIHRRTHIREKTFECNECGKTFGHSSNLILHRRVHTEEKPFICNECGKTFGRNSSLFNHKKSHT